VVVVYFKVISTHVYGGTEENHGYIGPQTREKRTTFNGDFRQDMGKIGDWERCR
jgi:hypothetical protein